MTRSVMLVHGGLYEGMDAERFWTRPGVLGGLAGRGLAVTAPNRVSTPESWTEEASHLNALVGDRGPLDVVAGSNGCSVAVRVAVDFPELVASLVLCWPATNSTEANRLMEPAISRSNPAAVDALLAGGTLRGCREDELEAIGVPVAIVRSLPQNVLHTAETIDSLLSAIDGAVVIAECPESPRPDFEPHLSTFVDVVGDWVEQRD